MQVFTTTDLKITKLTNIGLIRKSIVLRKRRGKRKGKTSSAELSAFDLFNLFTAEIIRSKEVFTR